MAGLDLARHAWSRLNVHAAFSVFGPGDNGQAVSRFIASRYTASFRPTTVAVTFLIMLAAIFLAAPAAAQPIDSASEQSIKAAYLFRFADYIEWPGDVLADPEIPLTIGVVGADSLAVELREITRGRRFHDRPVVVRNVKEQESVEGIHILFVAAGGSSELSRLVAQSREHAVLVVSDFDDALQSGSVINFRTIQQRIRFEVSLDSADRHGLRLSARLLAVAAHVEPRQN